jgi:serine/threonine protein kinase
MGSTNAASNEIKIPFIPPQIQEEDLARIVENEGLLLSKEQIETAQQLLSENKSYLPKKESELPCTVVKFQDSDDLYAIYSGKKQDERILGKGMVGKVKLMQKISDSNPGEWFAIKVITLDEYFHEMEYEREKFILKLINSSVGGFKQIRFSEGKEEKTQCIIGMKIVPGITLEKLMETRSLSTGEVLSIIKASLDTMLAMKACGVVHNDLHSGNILYDSEHERIGFVDFGSSLINRAPHSIEKTFGIETPHNIIHNISTTSDNDGQKIYTILLELLETQSKSDSQLFKDIKKIINTIFCNLKYYAKGNTGNIEKFIGSLEDKLKLEDQKDKQEIKKVKDLYEAIKNLQVLTKQYPTPLFENNEIIDINRSPDISSQIDIDAAVLIHTTSNDLEAVVDVQKAVELTRDLQEEGVTVKQTLYQLNNKEEIKPIAEQIDAKSPDKIISVSYQGKILNDKFTAQDQEKVSTFLANLAKENPPIPAKRTSITKKIEIETKSKTPPIPAPRKLITQVKSKKFKTKTEARKELLKIIHKYFGKMQTFFGKVQQTFWTSKTNTIDSRNNPKQTRKTRH